MSVRRGTEDSGCDVFKSYLCVLTRALPVAGMVPEKSERTFTCLYPHTLFDARLFIRMFLRECRVAGHCIQSEEENQGMRSGMVETLPLYIDLCSEFF